MCPLEYHNWYDPIGSTRVEPGFGNLERTQRGRESGTATCAVLAALRTQPCRVRVVRPMIVAESASEMDGKHARRTVPTNRSDIVTAGRSVVLSCKKEC